jgi:Na+-driven multidrug efflux pump
MKGMGIHHYVFVHSIVCMWVIGLGTALLIAFTSSDLGIIGLYWGYGNGLLVLCFCNIYYIYKAKWEMVEM